MSANYWISSQRNKWQFTRDELAASRNYVVQLELQLYGNNNNNNTDKSIKYDINMRIYLHQLIIKLGRKLNLRQIILSTAEIYLSRFLTRVSIREINIYLLITTCIYVSCKIEENPQHIRTLLSEARNCWPEFIPNDLTKLAEFEFYLIEEMDCYLIIHHPYNSLLDIIKVLKENSIVDSKLELTPEEVQTCWSVINDSYITDLHLLFPPHIIAIGSMYLTLILGTDLDFSNSNFGNNTNSSISDLKNPSNPSSNRKYSNSFNPLSKPNINNNHIGNPRIEAFVKFLAYSNVDLDEIIETVQEMLTLCESWSSYDEICIRNGIHHLLLSMNR